MSDGEYWFSGVVPNRTYTVTEVVPDGSKQTTENPPPILLEQGIAWAATPEQARSGAPEPVEGFAIIGAYEDHFVRTPAGWRIAERELRGVFRYEDAP